MRASQISPDLANRPLIRIRPSARALRDSYRICLSNLQRARAASDMHEKGADTRGDDDGSIAHLLFFRFSL